MSDSPSEITTKRSLRRRHSSSSVLSHKNKSLSKSRSLEKRHSRSSSRTSSIKSRSHSDRGNKRRSSSQKTKRRYSRSRSYDNKRRSRRFSRNKSPPRYSKFNRMKNENAEPCTCIGIFGLSKKTKEETLWDKFEKYGKIDNVRLIMDRGKRESLGYAFIDYKEIEFAMKAMKEAHGSEIDGNNIRLDYSVGKKPASTRFFKDNTSAPYNRYDSKYRSNGYRDQRRRSRSKSSSRGSYRKRRNSPMRRSRSRRSHSSRGSFRKHREPIKRRSRSKNSYGENSRKRKTSRRRSNSRRSTHSSR